MQRKVLISVGALTLALSGVANAVPDQCDDGGGYLAGSFGQADSDTLWVPDGAEDHIGRTVVVGDFNGDGIDDLAFGADGADVNGPSSGAVYIVLSPNSDLGQAGQRFLSDVDVVIAGESFLDRSGFALANAGDVDQDGKDDLIVGSLPDGGTSGGAGIAHLVLGSTISSDAQIDLATESAARFFGEFAGDEFGSAVAGVGDVNDDGFADIVIGAPKYSGVGFKTGAAYLFLGPITGDRQAGTDETARFDGATPSSSFGLAISSAGDIDNDGFDDILIGAPRDDTAATNAGAAYVYKGAPSFATTVAVSSAAFRLYGRQYERCGASVASAGDNNSDGYSDYWVGCKQFGSTKGGAAYIMPGRTGNGVTPLINQAVAAVYGAYANSLVGSSLAVADFNNDGHNDLLVGGERGKGTVVGSGAAWIVYGPFTGGGLLMGSTTDLLDADAIFPGTADAEFYGAAVAGGDTSGDGYAEAFVGGWQSSYGETRGGIVTLYRGGADTADLTTFYADADGDGYGSDNPADATEACSPPAGFTFTNTDCDDSSTLYHPSATETCGDPDYNCDDHTGPTDDDGDGFTACGGDCDDGDPNTNPSADERCNLDVNGRPDGKDNDCDGDIDEAIDAVTSDPTPDATTYYVDADGDGYGDRTTGFLACVAPASNLITTGGDCDDDDITIRPDAPELCGDFTDNDCDDEVDEGSAVDAQTFWEDGDGDGYGNPDSFVTACSQPVGYIDNRQDCFDGDSDLSPLAVETCDFLDNDCDGIHYLGGPLGVGSESLLTFSGEVASSKLRAIGFLGDQDFDGDDELVLAADRAVGAPVNGGVVYIRFGSVAGGDFSAAEQLADGSGRYDVRILGTRPDARLGTSFASGDFNGDGVADMAIGANGARVPSVNQGAVYVFYGPISPGNYIMEDADIILRGEASGNTFGSSIAAVDLNNDFYADLVMSAPAFTDTLPQQGKVYVMYGSDSLANGPALISTRADAWFLGTTSNERAGDSLGLIGDIDSDGFSDLAIGAPFRAPANSGGMHIIYGTGAPLSGAFTADATITGSSGTRFGTSIAGAGDFDGDGGSDFIVGTFEGNRAFLVLGTPSVRLVSSASTAMPSYVRFIGLFGQKVGRGVFNLGDLNQDGYDDVGVSAPDDDQAAGDAGAVYVVYGRENAVGLPSTGAIVVNKGDFLLDDVESYARINAPDLFPVYRAQDLKVFEGAKIMGEAGADNFASLIGGGDFDGDGYRDVVGSSATHDTSPTVTDTGKAYVLLGGPFGTDVFIGDGSQRTWYWDSDADGWTAQSLSTFVSCQMHVPISWRLPNDPRPRGLDTPFDPPDDLDCNDDDYRVHPGVVEQSGLDGIDADCDGFDAPNVLPVVTVDLLPNNPDSVDTLFADAHGSDASDPYPTTVSLEYRWYRVENSGGTEVEVELGGQTSATLAPSNFAAGQRIRVKVRGDDTRGFSDWVTDQVTIQNTPPVIDGCTATPATGDVTTSFSAASSGLFDEDPADALALHVNYQWQSLITGSWTNIPGQTSTSLASCQSRNIPGDPFACYRNSQLRVRCTANDGAQDGTVLNSNIIVIENSGPTVDTCEIAPLVAYTDTDLNASATAIDADGDVYTMSLVWLIDGVDTGATGSLLAHTYTSHFNNVQLRCTATDVPGTSSLPVLTSPVTILNTPPTAPTITLNGSNPTTVRSNQNLSVAVTTASTDADGDGITYEYRWSKDSAPFNNPTYPTSNATVQANSTAKGQHWAVTVTPNDGYDSGPSASVAVDVVNTPPQLTGVTISPLTPVSGQTLSAVSIDFYDYDPLDTDQSEYHWYVSSGGSPAVEVFEGPQLAPSFFARGDEVYVLAQAYDGEDYGNSVSSAAVTIANSAPGEATLGDMNPTPASESQDIECVVLAPAVDPDGDAVRYLVEFKALRPNDPYLPPGLQVISQLTLQSRPNTVGTTGGNYLLDSSLTEYGDQIWCEVTATDAAPYNDTGTTAIASAVTIQDFDEPPAPTIDAIERYRNSTAVNLTGTCVSTSNDCTQLVFQCQAAGSPNYVFGSGSDPDDGFVGTCNAGSFDETLTLPRGFDYSCWAFCYDATPNRSLNSTVKTTEVCNPYDIYETPGDGVGDTRVNAIEGAWGILDDSFSTSIPITGNIIGQGIEESDTYDWYLVRTVDDATADDTANSDQYNMQVSLTSGASSYRFIVVRDNGITETQQCSLTQPNGYDNYNFYNYDRGDYMTLGHPDHGTISAGQHQFCDNAGAQYNDCNDYTSNFYIGVTRESGTNCTSYTLTVTNGGPTANGATIP